jgi:hypothetical protein
MWIHHKVFFCYFLQNNIFVIFSGSQFEGVIKYDTRLTFQLRGVLGYFKSVKQFKLRAAEAAANF